MANSKEFFRITSKIKDLTFCACSQKLVFGVLKGDHFEDGQCFEFSLSDVCELFCALFYIVKAFTKGTGEN